MDAVGARRLFPRGVPPLIHHEDGFNADEAERLNWKRNAFRRWMLPTAAALVVPSARLEAIARDVWQQGPRVRRIANGIGVARYCASPVVGAIPGLERRDGEVIVGTLAGLRAVKNLPRLVRAVATLPPHVRLVIIGEGPERANILAEAKRYRIADRVMLPGFLADPARYIGHFDVFALSSDSEQGPIALMEAMAAGLPLASMDVGDVRNMLPLEQMPFVAHDEPGFAAALATLVADTDLRGTLGSANQSHAAAHFDETAMINAYRTLYWSAARAL